MPRRVLRATRISMELIAPRMRCIASDRCPAATRVCAPNLQASNGEICCSISGGRCDFSDQISGCTDGLREYREEYTKPLVDLFKKYIDKVQNRAPFPRRASLGGLPLETSLGGLPLEGVSGCLRAHRVEPRALAHGLMSSHPWADRAVSPMG